MTRHLHRNWSSLLLVAAIAFGTGCKSGPTAVDYLGDAREAYDAERYAEASTFLDLAEKKDAPARKVRSMRARIERSRAVRTLERGDDRAAYEQFIEAADHDPRRRASAQTYLRAVEIGRRLGTEPKELAQVAQKAVEADPSSLRARREAGQLWEAADKPEKAVEAYLWLWQSDTSQTDIGRRLAAVYQNLDRSEDAIAVLRQVLEEAPDDAQAALKLAELYDETGATRRARELFEKLVEEHPDKPGILLRYARFLEQQGDRQRARTLENRAYDKMPGKNSREMRDLQ